MMIGQVLEKHEREAEIAKECPGIGVYKSMTKGTFSSRVYIIEIGTKAGFLAGKWNVYIQAASTSTADKGNRRCRCVSCRLKLNSESLGHLTQAPALLSIGTFERTLSVLGRLARRYNWSRGSEAYRCRSRTFSQVKLKIEYWICPRCSKETSAAGLRRRGGRKRMARESVYGE